VADNGSQTTQLIAKRLRKRGFYTEVCAFDKLLDVVKAKRPKGIILSGSPASVYDEKAPTVPKEIFELAEVMGICYGTQLKAHLFDGEVEHSVKREYGRAHLVVDAVHPVFSDVPKTFVTWMSHGDKVTKLPPGYASIAHTDNCQYAAIAGPNFVGLQFHPEVTHTEHGADILENFARRVCNMQPTWNPGNFIKRATDEVKGRVGNTFVVGGVSGGVDSSTMAVLLHKILGDQFKGLFVDNGLLREGEAEQVLETAKRNNMQLIYVDASERFLDALRGVSNPDEKRKIIGREFIHAFDGAVRKNFGTMEKYLAQGTLYTDVIESVTVHGGPTSKIKRHHNVGGLPSDTLAMFKGIVEPFRYMFKDDVREVAYDLGMPEEIIGRHPFPGPGLAVRIIGEITPEKLYIARKSDAIFVEELKKHGLYNKVWQALTVVTDTKTVGVQGDEHSYSYVVGVRSVDSVDGMTADWSRLPHEFIANVSSRMTNEIKGVNRVVYDITSKPPGTIEWE
jgi:GMP synthase (glutamine-hydrolysing)